jgi:hypothetical protein
MISAEITKLLTQKITGVLAHVLAATSDQTNTLIIKAKYEISKYNSNFLFLVPYSNYLNLF